MSSDSAPNRPAPRDDRAFERQLREMNEKLLISSVRQHELTEQAEKAELRYRRLFETSQDGILILDNQTGKVTDVNPFLCKLLGSSPEALKGKELWEIGLFRDQSAQQAAGRKLKANGYLRYDQLPLQTHQGRALEVEVVANVYRENGHDVVQCNIRDITQRRKTEQALAKALVYSDDIISTLREPFLVLDADLRVRTANRSFYETFHVTKAETEKSLVYDLGNGQWDIASLRNLLNEVLSRNQAINDFEVEHAFPMLGRKTMLLNARPFPSDTKHPELILLSVQDITALRARANELAEANRQKDEFLAMLAHELRNPLAPILNAVHLLDLQKSENRIQQQARTIIERQVTHITCLVDDLMEVSRITTGRVHLRAERVDVRSIIKRVVQTTEPMIHQHNHTFTLSLPADPIWLNADSARLEQVLVNLLNNSVKYTCDGGHIWLTVEQRDTECVLRVRDTGVGIAPEFLPHIFDLFTQAERSLDRSQGGLGIGLALVKRLVEMHHGRVEVNSVLGRGSEFVVSLPMMLTSEGTLPSTSSETGRPEGPCLRVLVVDDNVDTAESLGMLLEASGHEVKLGHDGSTVLETALDYRPDVIFLDIGLPGINGYELAKRIRQHLVLRPVVLVAITGYGQAADLQRSQEAGFDHHLVKPVHFEKVREILSSVLPKAA